MILLNSKSILQCNENEEEIHNKEIQDAIDEIIAYKDYECALICKYQDPGHKNIEQRIGSCSFSELLEYLGTRDIKNGVDLYTDGQYLVFLVYGQGYTMIDTNEYHLVVEAIKIMPYINKEFYNVVYLLDGENPKQIDEYSES